MRIEGYKVTRDGEITRGIIPIYKIKAERCHNFIFFNHTKFERRKKMKTKVIITFLLILIMCGANSVQAGVVNPNSVVVDDIAYYFQTDKFVYNLDEEVEMLFRVTNLTENTVNLGKVIIPPFCYTFIVSDNDNNEVWYWPRSVPLPPPVDFVLGPYESSQYQRIWNMMNDNGTTETNDDFPVDPGLYNVTGYLWADEIIPVSVSIEIIPEPSTVFLLGTGLIGMITRKRRR